MHSSIGVFVVAPVLLCWGFENLVRTTPSGLRIVGSTPRLADAAVSLTQVRADVVVVDADEPMHAETLRGVSRDYPIVLLVPERELGNASHWRQAGAHAVLPRGASPAKLLRAVGTACGAGVSGRCNLAMIHVPQERDAEAEHDRIASLTFRERQLVFAVICYSTMPGKVLASRLCISEHTLRNHLTSIYGKLGVQNRLSLHEFALRHHLDEDAKFVSRG
ncbi:helix-turn-helix transcriptional regulator [Ramlibacter sp.]|uniref:helix-turn-helix transcriptional regulator n=1 Tax=Ramlibacter sp. TaxID=1917967 RepID=UPI002FCA9176